MSQDLVLVDGPKQVSFFESSPKAMVERATEISNVLKRIIDDRKLYVNIQGKNHVLYEGWITLGNFLGVLPRVIDVRELEDGSFEAKVDLVSVKTGIVMGGAHALCSSDERRWGKADKYARHSMAVTRATGKAYRLAFSWIMVLAGYDATPAEEIPKKIDHVVYDPKNQEHYDRLKRYMIQAGLNETQKAEVEHRMVGRPTSDLPELVRSVRQ